MKKKKNNAETKVILRVNLLKKEEKCFYKKEGNQNQRETVNIKVVLIMIFKRCLR